MEWWEYLVVIGVSGFLLLFIAAMVVEYKDGERIHKLQYVAIIISLCFLLLMIITYKLFFT